MGIGARLREERDRLGMNQEGFGLLGGVRKQAQLLYEKDERKPDSDYLAAVAEAGVDVLYVDTAGRLQTKVNLMEELTKIRQVLGKKHAGAPHRTILVIDATTGAVLSAMSYNATLATGVFSISGNVVSFHSSDASKRVRITYKYAPTVTEAKMIYGQGVGDGAQSTIGSVGVITRAPILFTDMYDAGDNWAAGGAVYTGATGRVTLKTSGTALPGVIVAQAPSIANGGMLGLTVK